MLRSPASLAGMSSWIFLPYAGLFFGLALWKSPHIFKHPRFWAEEGSRFYAHCQGGSFWHCMEYVHGDSYHLLANTLVSLAAAASVEDAPAVTTYLAFAVELAVVVQIVLFCSEYRLSPLIAALLVAAWAMLPGRYEVWLSATTIQWVAGISVLWLLVMPQAWIERHWRGLALWCAVCGLSGVPAVLIAPIFLVRAVAGRSRPVLWMSLVLGVCAVFQLSLFAVFGSVRPFAFHPLELGGGFLLQSVLSPILSVDIAQRALSKTTWIGVILLALAVVVVAISGARSGVGPRPVALLIIACCFVSLVQAFGSLGPTTELLTGWAGGRYFLFGSVCLCILLAWGTRAVQTGRRRAAVALLASVVLAGIAQAQWSKWPRSMLAGPSWRQQVHACRAGEVCRVAVWPDPSWGQSWTVEIVR
jgi:hypothetical protein